MGQEENILGTEKIGTLIRKFSIPCIISLLVNSLYNIVDQIFIGWKVGYLGNGATNVVFPLTMLCLAFGNMLGDGSCAFFSLKLGEKKNDEAGKGVGNGIILSLLISISICAASIIFLPQILDLFGSTGELKDYALQYGFIIAIGIPFSMIGATLNSIIRADGSPKYAMFSMVSGAFLNVVLDYVFIFWLNMGVKGAATATVVSQFFTAILNVIYIRKFRNIKVDKSTLRLDLHTCKNISVLGISSFINQISFVFVIAIQNNLLGKYGAYSEFGSEIPITVLGIVMKITAILNSFIYGIAAGSQPIVGYNYGAEKYDRVKRTLKIELTSSLVVSTLSFMIVQLFPDKLIAIFGSGDEKYMEFACLAFRAFLMLSMLNGVQLPSGIFFQAIGKSVKSSILSLSRQILFLIPSMIIMGRIFGIMGVLYAGAVADGMAFVLATVLFVIEGKELNKKQVFNN